MYEDDIDQYYEKNLISFNNLQEAYSSKENINLNKLSEEFKEEYSAQISTKFQNHIEKLSILWSKRDGLYYKDLIKTLNNNLIPSLQKDIKNLRKSVFCMLCDWHNQNFINIENGTITYKNDFCMALIDNHLETFFNKYAQVIYNLMILDEWSFLLTNFRLVSSVKDRQTFRNYIVMINQCYSS